MFGMLAASCKPTAASVTDISPAATLRLSSSTLIPILLAMASKIGMPSSANLLRADMVATPSVAMSASLSVISATIFSGFPRATPNLLKSLIKPVTTSGRNFI